MEIVRCSKGHFYDSEEYSTCPVCAAGNGSNRMLENILATDAFLSDPVRQAANEPGPTAPADENGSKVQKYRPTEPANGGSNVQAYGPTVGVGYANLNQNGGDNKVPPIQPTVPNPVTPYPSSAVPTVFNPVVGWLACISGPSKGASYVIHSQYNFIGRSSRMDISIPEDPHISAENSAVIAYDDIERVFYFGPGSGHNGVRVNGKMILNTTLINAYDVLTVGLTKLLFVPLCGDRFDWNETE